MKKGMKRVQLTLDQKSLDYLNSLVDSGECASLSHAVRRSIARLMQGKEKQ